MATEILDFVEECVSRWIMLESFRYIMWQLESDAVRQDDCQISLFSEWFRADVATVPGVTTACQHLHITVRSLIEIHSAVQH